MKNLTSQSQDVEPVSEIDLWVSEFSGHLALQKRRSPRTVEAYTQVIHRFLMSEDFRGSPDAIQKGSVRRFLRTASASLAPASQAQWASALKCFLEWCRLENKGLDPSLLREITRPRVGKRLASVVDEEDIALLVKCVQERPVDEQLLFELLYGSGLRISEAHALTIHDFKLKERELWVRGKGSKIRKVPLSPNALTLLAEKKTSELWEQSPTVRTMRRWVETWGSLSLLKESSGRLHPHKLRHSIATHLLRRGAKLPQIQKLLGHSRLGTTEIYTHLNTEDLVRVYDQSFPTLGDTPAIQTSNKSKAGAK